MIRYLEGRPRTLSLVKVRLGLLTFFGLLLSVGVFFGSPSAFGSGQADTQTTPAVAGARGDRLAGKTIYERYCHYCHGRQGYGDGPVGTAITPHPADFVHDSKRMAKSDEKLFKSIRDGVQRKIGGEAMAMPRWADILTEKQTWDVLAYIRQLEGSGRIREGLDINSRKGASVPADSKKR